MDSNVEHPKHYNTGRIEVIDFIESCELNFSRGNVIKYVSRAGFKNRGSKTSEIEDLKKALWYLEREISNLTNNP
jgi:hypothetical protein